ncbi:MAG: orotidine-5'-phosphate decarboxylase [Acidimicrobiales bacterium]|nr:orotidine-5'-phosphate decarboxylase [Acidimicrobiales bacterium]
MTLHPADRIDRALADTGSIACVGLDPRPELIPPALRRAALQRHGDTAAAFAEAVVAYNLGLLDAVVGRCAAVKPQVACYEAYGSAGWRALEETVAAARERGIAVVFDGKRNDIGSTATHYAQGAFGGAPGLDGAVVGGLGCAWLTVNGYLGADGIEPFLAPDAASSEHGVFVLVRTSNPSAGDLQDQASGAGTVADRMAALVAGWGGGRRGGCGLSDVGAVVGATWPEQARALRSAMPDTLFLVPGYGAQGGSAADAVAGRRSVGAGHPGLLVNSSRQILGAWQQHGADDWAGAARRALDVMNGELAAALR